MILEVYLITKTSLSENHKWIFYDEKKLQIAYKNANN